MHDLQCCPECRAGSIIAAYRLNTVLEHIDMTTILEVKNLVKKYKKLTAVNGVSFSIAQGQCFALLGPNGAGKTTALEVIENIMPPTSGQILYRGRPRSSSFREEIGIQFQHTSLLNFLTVQETLVTFSKMYKDPESVDALVELCGLQEILARMNNKISGGQQQRLLLALALVNKPELLFLDEPSTGLDPKARHNLWDIVLKIKQQGKTIILTTHSMEEAEYLCDEVAIMDRGKIIAHGSPAALIRQHCNGNAIILPRSSLNIPMEELPFHYHALENSVELQTDNIQEGLEKLMALNISLSEMIVRSPNLEDVFLTLTGRQLRD